MNVFKMLVMCSVVVAGAAVFGAEDDDKDKRKDSTEDAKIEAYDKISSSALEMQVILDRLLFSPGAIDGLEGTNVEHALKAWQQANELEATGDLDKETSQALVAAGGGVTALMPYQISDADLAQDYLTSLPEKMEEQALLPALSYTTVTEMLGERFHATPELLLYLNPEATWSAGETVMVPNVQPTWIRAAEADYDKFVAAAYPAAGATDAASGATGEESSADSAEESDDAKNQSVDKESDDAKNEDDKKDGDEQKKKSDDGKDDDASDKKQPEKDGSLVEDAAKIAASAAKDDEGSEASEKKSDEKESDEKKSDEAKDDEDKTETATSQMTAGAVATGDLITSSGLPVKPEGKLTVIVTKSDTSLNVVDETGRVIFHAPVSAGSEHDPLPLGEWKVNGTERFPMFNYNPELFWDAEEDDKKAKIPAGPNGPVGVAWIDISKDHYGLHGTPNPEKIGYTESHGCVRLSNWNVLRLADMVKKDTKVLFLEKPEDMEKVLEAMGGASAAGKAGEAGEAGEVGKAGKAGEEKKEE